MNYQKQIDSYRPIPFYFLTTTASEDYTDEAVFEAMQYPLPSKEEQIAKKAKALAPQEISSSERGNGSRNTQSNEKTSVREKLEVMKEVAEKQKMPPVRSKDRAR